MHPCYAFGDIDGFGGRVGWIIEEMDSELNVSLGYLIGGECGCGEAIFGIDGFFDSGDECFGFV